MKKYFCAALFVAAIFPASIFVGGSAIAAPIPGLINTDAALLADGALDPNWTVNGGAPVVYNNPAYLVDPNARFIAAQAGGGYSVNPNTYDLTFSLAGLDPATASLSGNFASDNFGDVFLNGHLLAQQPHLTIFANFQSLTAFSAIGADFVSGLNTLEFVVTDTGPPSALLVTDLTGQADVSAVPEPFTLSLFGAGFAGAVAMRRRKKKLG